MDEKVGIEYFYPSVEIGVQSFLAEQTAEADYTSGVGVDRDDISTSVVDDSAG